MDAVNPSNAATNDERDAGSGRTADRASNSASRADHSASAIPSSSAATVAESMKPVEMHRCTEAGTGAMSKHGTLLPFDPVLIAEYVQAWEHGVYSPHLWPRSAWLHDLELDLSYAFPQSSSADRRLTARSVAPFPLRDGHDVP